MVLAGVWGLVSGFEWSMVVPQPTISPVSPKNVAPILVRIHPPTLPNQSPFSIPPHIFELLIFRTILNTCKRHILHNLIKFETQNSKLKIQNSKFIGCIGFIKELIGVLFKEVPSTHDFMASRHDVVMT